MAVIFLKKRFDFDDKRYLQINLSFRKQQDMLYIPQMQLNEVI